MQVFSMHMNHPQCWLIYYCSIEAADKMNKNESRMREIAKEREVMIQRFTQLKKNREAAMGALEARVGG